MKKLLLLVVIAAGCVYGALSRHFILFDNSLKILKKTSLRCEDTFVDARGNRKMGLLLKPDLIAAGIGDIVEQIDRSVKKFDGQ